MSKERVQQLAQRGFEAYNNAGPNPGLAHDGKPVPAWNDIQPKKKEQIHGKWRAATEVIATGVIDEATSGAEPIQIPRWHRCAARWSVGRS